MAQCGTMMGGRVSRRRKGSKKTRKTRKMRGGVMYGPTQAITPGALQWGAVDTSAPYDSATGAKMNDPFGTSPYTNAKVTGAGRRRTRKGKGKKSRKTKRSRKMRGGMFPGSVNPSPVGTGFVGGIPGFPTGSQTYGAYSGYPQKVPAGEPHTTGPDGVKQL